MAGDLSYTPLYSGRSHAIFSMGADDLRNKNAFFNGLAHKIRQYGYPNGSEALDVENRVWAFYEGVINDSPKVFEIIMISRNRYNFSYTLGGVQRSGSVEDLADIRGILP